MRKNAYLEEFLKERDELNYSIEIEDGKEGHDGESNIKCVVVTLNEEKYHISW
jgi:hypothetical protein